MFGLLLELFLEKAVIDSIGSGVEVPPLFYKIVIYEEDSEPVILAFLFPHQVEDHGDIQDFLVSVDIIEALTSLDFFQELNDEELERMSTWINWESEISFLFEPRKL